MSKARTLLRTAIVGGTGPNYAEFEHLEELLTTRKYQLWNRIMHHTLGAKLRETAAELYDVRKFLRKTMKTDDSYLKTYWENLDNYEDIRRREELALEDLVLLPEIQLEDNLLKQAAELRKSINFNNLDADLHITRLQLERQGIEEMVSEQVADFFMEYRLAVKGFLATLDDLKHQAKSVSDSYSFKGRLSKAWIYLGGDKSFQRSVGHLREKYQAVSENYKKLFHMWVDLNHFVAINNINNGYGKLAPFSFEMSDVPRLTQIKEDLEQKDKHLVYQFSKEGDEYVIVVSSPYERLANADLTLEGDYQESPIKRPHIELHLNEDLTDGDFKVRTTRSAQKITVYLSVPENIVEEELKLTVKHPPYFFKRDEPLESIKPVVLSQFPCREEE